MIICMTKLILAYPFLKKLKTLLSYYKLMLELSPNGPSIAGLTFLVLSYNKCLRLIIIEIFLFNKIPSTNFYIALFLAYNLASL
jgi:hypothetical protein